MMSVNSWHFQDEHGASRGFSATLELLIAKSELNRTDVYYSLAVKVEQQHTTQLK